jgi:putative inorganic carbon (hco3(-)) transporter
LNTILGFLGVPIIMWAIVCTQSRGGLLGIVSVFGVVGLKYVRSRAVLIGGGLIMVVLLYAMMGISGRVSGGAAEQGIDASAMGRLNSWIVAFRMLAARPITGVGLENFGANYFVYTTIWTGSAKAVHNTWLSVLAETGLVGMTFFVWMVVECLRAGIRSMTTLDRPDVDPVMRGMSLALVAGLVSFCIAGTFLSQAFTWPIYILLALTTALARWVRANVTPLAAPAPAPVSARSAAPRRAVRFQPVAAPRRRPR